MERHYNITTPQLEINLQLMELEEVAVVDIYDPRNITLTESEIKEAEKKSKNWFFLLKLIRTYKLVHSNVYKESLIASQNEVMQLNEMIIKENNPTKKKQLIDSKGSCIKTISQLEKLCEQHEGKSAFDGSEQDITAQAKHRK